MAWLSLIKVSGQSLEPDFRDGDFVWVSKIPILLKRVHPGDAIVFRHAVYGVMVKIVEWIEPETGRLWVVGRHTASIDSRTFGLVELRQIAGKVIGRISRPE